MNDGSLTIGRLARSASVGIETIRYYQRRNLLPLPDADAGAFRHYPPALVDRIRFIKRSQELGFSLDEIAMLLQFEDGANRRAIRLLAGAHLDDVREKIADLKRIERALATMIQSCEATGRAQPCPIISTLAGKAKFKPPIPDSTVRSTVHAEPSRSAAAELRTMQTTG